MNDEVALRPAKLRAEAEVSDLSGLFNQDRAGGAMRLEPGSLQTSGPQECDRDLICAN